MYPKPKFAKVDFESKNHFNTTGETHQSLGDRIIASIKYASPIDAGVAVKYDDEENSDVDAYADFKHDFFDVAEIGTPSREGEVNTGIEPENNKSE